MADSSTKGHSLGDCSARGTFQLASYHQHLMTQAPRSSRRSWTPGTLAIAKSHCNFSHWEPPDNLCILCVEGCEAKAYGAESCL